MHEQITVLPGESAQPLAFPPHHQRDRASEISLEQTRLCFTGRADQPDSSRLQGSDGSREVRDLNEGKGLNGSAGFVDFVSG